MGWRKDKGQSQRGSGKCWFTCFAVELPKTLIFSPVVFTSRVSYICLLCSSFQPLRQCGEAAVLGWSLGDRSGLVPGAPSETL